MTHSTVEIVPTPALLARIEDRLETLKPFKDAPSDLPSRRTIKRWEEEQPELARSFARARKARGDAAAEEAERYLIECDPEKGDPKTASARVSLAQYRSAYYRWLAGCLDRETYGEKVSVDGKLALAIIAAFPDLTPKPLASVAVDPALPPAPKVGETQYDAP